MLHECRDEGWTTRAGRRGLDDGPGGWTTLRSISSMVVGMVGVLEFSLVYFKDLYEIFAVFYSWIHCTLGLHALYFGI